MQRFAFYQGYVNLNTSTLQMPYTIPLQPSPSRTTTPQPTPTNPGIMNGQAMYHPNMMTIPEGEPMVAPNPLPPPPPP